MSLFLIPYSVTSHYPLFFFFLQEKHILHTKSAHRMFVGSVQTSVVGISHRFNMPSDAGSQLRALSAFLGKCRENMHGTTEVILKRSTNIPADANAVSVLVADLDKFSEEGMHSSKCLFLLNMDALSKVCCISLLLCKTTNCYIYVLYLTTTNVLK